MPVRRDAEEEWKVFVWRWLNHDVMLCLVIALRCMNDFDDSIDVV